MSDSMPLGNMQKGTINVTGCVVGMTSSNVSQNFGLYIGTLGFSV